MIKHEGFTDTELEAFRAWQRASYEVLGAVASRIEPGVTERDAGRWAMKEFRAAGADRFFHLPVALFGVRTTLPDPWVPESFWPDERPIEAGDAVVLDASPIFDGFVVDTSISVVCGADPDPVHAAAKADDLVYRTSILDALRSGATFREIALSVDADMTARGDRNCHRLHPEAVLGHRVVRVTDVGALPAADPAGFDATVLGWFIEGIAAATTGGSAAPTWNDRDTSAHPPPPGLWAVEPHLARGAVGVKWEEILVVEGADAYWLDDDVPHVRSASVAR